MATNESNRNEECEKPATMKNGNKTRLTLIIAVAIIIGGFFGTKWTIHRIHYSDTDDAQVTADLIPVSFKVPGRIMKILVKEGDTVVAGQQVAILDPTDFQLALDKANANLEIARKDLEKAQSALDLTRTRTNINVLQSSSSLDQVEGGVSISSTQKDVNLARLEGDAERARINTERAQGFLDEVHPSEQQARADLERSQNLYNEGVISKEELENSQTRADMMAGRLTQAEQGLADAQNQLDIAESNLQSATVDTAKVDIAKQDREKANLSLTLSKEQEQEEVKMAELTVESLTEKVNELQAEFNIAKANLDETSLLSPVDGIIAKKISLQAEVVATGKPIVFVIDKSSTIISANIVEKDLKDIHVGSKAIITIDALPGRTFEGEVITLGAATNSKFSLIPQSNPSGQYIKVAQRVPIKISLSGDITELKPGMNAVVSIRK